MSYPGEQPDVPFSAEQLSWLTRHLPVPVQRDDAQQGSSHYQQPGEPSVVASVSPSSRAVVTGSGRISVGVWPALRSLFCLTSLLKGLAAGRRPRHFSPSVREVNFTFGPAAARGRALLPVSKLKFGVQPPLRALVCFGFQAQRLRFPRRSRHGCISIVFEPAAARGRALLPVSKLTFGAQPPLPRPHLFRVPSSALRVSSPLASPSLRA